jgi:hypothetical protein
MELKTLKQGDVFYDVNDRNIIKYEYLMLYPFHNPKNVKIEGYHIILNKSLDEPIRIYYNDLKKILDLKCFSYEDAKLKQIEILEDKLEFLKKNQN